MSSPFLNTAPGYDEELRNSVFFERGLHATSICNPLSDEELARKFHDNAVRSLPEERAAELAARTLAFLTLRASRISPRC